MAVGIAGCGSSGPSAHVVAKQLAYALDAKGETVVVFSDVRCKHRSGDVFACRVHGLDGHWHSLAVTDNGRKIAWR